ncbi:MAG: DUF4402 domain-containing protein [Mariniphaga sp.]
MHIKQFTATYKRNISGLNCRLIFLFSVVALFSLFCHQLQAQSPFPPPSQLQVYANQELAFGSFFTGTSGGTVTISPTGTRSVTGTVVGLALSSGSAAIFDLRLIPGRIVHIVFPVSAQLTRIGGGETMTITNFISDKPGNSFVTTASHPFINPVQIGATLNVQNSTVNPPGDYTGTFTVTFIQE